MQMERPVLDNTWQPKETFDNRRPEQPMEPLMDTWNIKDNFSLTDNRRTEQPMERLIQDIWKPKDNFPMPDNRCNEQMKQRLPSTMEKSRWDPTPNTNFGRNQAEMSDTRRNDQMKQLPSIMDKKLWESSNQQRDKQVS